MCVEGNIHDYVREWGEGRLFRVEKIVEHFNKIETFYIVIPLTVTLCASVVVYVYEFSIDSKSSE